MIKIRFILSIILALLSLILSVLCFGVILVSCSGHVVGWSTAAWLIPLSLFGAWIFMYLASFFWRTRRQSSYDQFKKEAKSLPKKTAIFLISFSVTVLSFLLLSWLILLLAIRSSMSDWVGYIFYAVFTVLAISSGVFAYKKMIKKNV